METLEERIAKRISVNGMNVDAHYVHQYLSVFGPRMMRLMLNNN